MGKIHMSGAGGGGVSSDELTATAACVLDGESYAGADTDDEVGIGTMPNIGAQTGSLNCGASVPILKGYHDGTGKIAANSLASQTAGTAIAAHIYSGDTAWVKGVKLTGTMTVNSLTSFKAAVASGKAVTLTWTVPTAISGRPFSGVHVRYKTGSAPTNISDGTPIYTGNNGISSGTTSVTVTLPALGTTYYFSAWSYATINNVKVYSNSYKTASCTTASAIQKIFTSTQTYTIPVGYTKLDVFCVGGGGSGGYGNPGNADARCSGGGGGGGYTVTRKGITVTPGTVYAVTVGAGGNSGNNGEASSFGSLVTASGGTTAIGVSSSSTLRKAKLFGGNGGSGGGRNAWVYDSGSESENPHGNGGTNGGNGYGAGSNSTSMVDSTSTDGSYGKGQGTTTRAFGSSSGTLYSGGGGGGTGDATTIYGYGGSGGGGNGGSTNTYPTSGAENTGGGGGGGGGKSSYATPGSGGSGIVIIKLYA